MAKVIKILVCGECSADVTQTGWCPYCNGITAEPVLVYEREVREELCPWCVGTGILDESVCSGCQGSGTVLLQ